MNLSQLSDEEVEGRISVWDSLSGLEYKTSLKYFLLDRIVDYYEEQLRRWSEKRKFKKTQAA
jgi:hypothetical protein